MFLRISRSRAASARRPASEAARVQRTGNIGDLSVQPLRGIEPQDTALRVLVELLEGAKLRFGDLLQRQRIDASDSRTVGGGVRF